MSKPQQNKATVTAGVLIIGNEILSGRTQDTNLNHIARSLGEWGIQVREARVVPDVEPHVVNSVNEMRATFDYVFTTGGIGPTHDDVTLTAIAGAFRVKLVESAELLAEVRKHNRRSCRRGSSLGVSVGGGGGGACEDLVGATGGAGANSSGPPIPGGFFEK